LAPGRSVFMEIRKLRTKKFYNIGHWCRNERVGGGGWECLQKLIMVNNLQIMPLPAPAETRARCYKTFHGRNL
jgi:hypothetical protein